MVGKGFIYPENFLCSAASEVAVRTYRQATVRRRRNELLISITLSFEKHCGEPSSFAYGCTSMDSIPAWPWGVSYD